MTPYYDNGILLVDWPFPELTRSRPQRAPAAGTLPYETTPPTPRCAGRVDFRFVGVASGSAGLQRREREISPQGWRRRHQLLAGQLPWQRSEIRYQPYPERRPIRRSRHPGGQHSGRTEYGARHGGPPIGPRPYVHRP